MSSLKKKCQVVMLSTEKASKIVLQGYKGLGGLLFSNNQYIKSSNYQPQHLYILSDEEIKEGDWYLADERISKSELKPIWVVRKCDNITNGWLESNSNPGQGDNPDWSKKIIATTDIPLGTSEYSEKYRESYFNPLPQPSPEFITKYIEEYNKGNVITDIMVEYILNETGNYRQFDDTPELKEKLKTDSNNCITITKVRDWLNIQQHGNTLEYWKNSAEENYLTTPISVLKYITCLEESLNKQNL